MLSIQQQDALVQIGKEVFPNWDESEIWEITKVADEDDRRKIWAANFKGHTDLMRSRFYALIQKYANR